MTYTLKRSERTTHQRPIAVVGGTPERLEYITSEGNHREGEPEAIWQELATPQPYFREAKDRGRTRTRVDTHKFIVVHPRRGSIRDLVRTCDGTHWTGITKGSGKYHTLTHDNGPTVHRLDYPGTLEEVATALFRYVDFLNEHSAIFHSTVTGGGLALFKTTLDEPVKMWAPDIATEALWPGRAEYFRQEQELFYGMAYYDLKEAYPTALMDEPIPIRWKHTNPEKWRQHPDGFSLATAFVPYDDPPPHPLPLRLNKGRKSEHLVWPRGIFSGWWNHRDMRIADDLGYIVRVDESWIPDAFTDVFQSERWRELRIELRKLGLLGKMADNGLWGLMSFDGTKQKRVRWVDKQGTQTAKVGDVHGIREVHSIGVALAATSRVREKLWHGIAATDAVYCATDGMIAKHPPRSPLPERWVVKELYTMIDIKDSGFYRWISPDRLTWQYLRGGKSHFEGHSGKRRDRIGDEETQTLPPASIRELHKLGELND